MVLAISEYLSLNDAVATFSPGVLPLLWNYNLKLPAVHPSNEFLNVMNKTNNLDKIIGVRVNADQLTEVLNITVSDKFNSMPALPFNDDEHLPQISLMDKEFSNLTYLSVLYEGETRFDKLYQIFHIIPHAVKYLKIHCRSIQCSYCSLKILDSRQIISNQTVDSFVFHFNVTSQSLTKECCPHCPKCLLTTIIELIKLMPNVRNVRVFNEENIEMLLDLEEWVNLMNSCQRLNTIKLQRSDCSSLQLERMTHVDNRREKLHEKRLAMSFESQIK